MRNSYRQYYAYLKQTVPNLKKTQAHIRGFSVKTAVHKCLGTRWMFIVMTKRNIQKESIKNEAIFLDI